MEKETMIDIANQFTRFPGGRFLEDGEYSGQRFREEFLVPAFREGGKVSVQLDGTLGFGSSFLEEAFGGLLREHGMSRVEVLGRLKLLTENEALRYTIEQYIEDASRNSKVKN